MKKTIVILLLLLAVPEKGFSSDNSICVNLTWQLSVRGGIEHKFNHRLGIKSDIGISFFGLLTADALLAVYLLPEKYRWELNICTGIPNFAVHFTFEAAMMSLGGSLLTRFKINEKVSLDLRVGGGIPLFFEKGEDVSPFGFWPDFVLGVSFRI